MILVLALVVSATTLTARIDAIGREALQRYRIPGLAIGVMRNGEVLITREYGKADPETPVSTDSVFIIASVTKNFTAAAILHLIDRGLVSLDDDIGKHVPDFPHRDKGVTIRRLLNHTAGVRNITAIPAYWRQIAQPIEPARLIDIFRDSPLDFKPGSSYSYSNSGYILLGAVIEKASGMSYGDYLRRNFFAPLGMTHTAYCGTRALVRGRVRGYERKDDAFADARHVDMSQGYSAGGICSTAGDLLRWQQALNHGKVLERRTLKQMVTPENGRTYAFGIATGSNSGHRVLFHAGGIYGYDAMLTEYPDDDVAIAVLANISGSAAGDIEARIARTVLEIPEPRAIDPSENERKRLAGNYRARNFELQIENRDGSLFLVFDPHALVRLIPLGDGRFAQQDSSGIVELDGNRVKLTHYGTTGFEASRTPSTGK